MILPLCNYLFHVGLLPLLITLNGLYSLLETPSAHIYLFFVLFKMRYNVKTLKDNVINNMAWWLKSAGALNFALPQEQCPISL